MAAQPIPLFVPSSVHPSSTLNAHPCATETLANGISSDSLTLGEEGKEGKDDFDPCFMAEMGRVAQGEHTCPGHPVN